MTIALPKAVLVIGLLAGFNAQVFGSGNSTVEEAAEALFDEYWQMTLQDYPELATRVGDHRFDDRLTSYSLKSYEKRKVVMTEFLERASQLGLASEGSDTLDNLEYFIVMLQFAIEDIMSGSHLFPVSMLHTPEMDLTYLLKYLKMEEAKNFWDLILRYKAFPQQIEDKIELMREGIRTNFTLHSLSWKSTNSSGKNWNATESRFCKPFTKLSSLNLTEEEAKAIERNASDATENFVLPALRKLDDFMDNEYLPNARPEIGVGRDFYAQQLAKHLTDKGVSPEDIHRMGLEEVQRIAGEMDQVIQSLGLNVTLEEFGHQLKTNKSQFFESEDEALEVYRQAIYQLISPKLPKIFKHIPSKEVKVKKVPPEFSTGPRAYYASPSSDNSTPGTFYLDTSSLSNLPQYEVITLAMHEALPGHHFQISYSMEQEGMPEFRKYLTSSTAFTEGWALYAEYLGYELGLYEDPYMRYGHLSEEMFRACRMVVDTGMHVLGWSRQQAIDFMLRYTAATKDNIEREVDRYITWPGQACAYKYGEMKIKHLRQTAELELGAAFDIKEFHDVILRSNGPLALVQKQVKRYIQKTKDLWNVIHNSTELTN